MCEKVQGGLQKFECIDNYFKGLKIEQDLPEIKWVLSSFYVFPVFRCGLEIAYSWVVITFTWPESTALAEICCRYDGNFK